MKTAELRKKSKEELKELLQRERSKADELSWLLRQKKAKNVKELSGVKKNIARIMTLLKNLEPRK